MVAAYRSLEGNVYHRGFGLMGSTSIAGLQLRDLEVWSLCGTGHYKV